MALIFMTTEFDKVINKTVLKFYDTEKQSIIKYEDQSEFRPYCLAKIDYDQFYLFCYKNSENKTVLMDDKKKKKPKVEEESEESEDDEEGKDSEEEEEEDISEVIMNKKVKKHLSQEEEIDSALNESESINIPTFPSLPIERIEKFNPLTHKTEKFVKISGNTPLDIADQWNLGGVNISRFLICKEGDRIVDNYGYENTIQPRLNYVFDKQYIFGMPYALKRKEIEIQELKKCPQCGYHRGYFTYYIRKEGKSDNNVMLGKIVCEGCNEPIFPNEISNEFTDNKEKFQPYFKVNREFDLITVKKNRIVPVLSQSEIQKIDPKIIETVNLLFKNESPQEQELIRSWIPLFFTKIPTDFQRVAMDIEVFVTSKTNPDEFPSPIEALYPVSSVNFTDITGKKITFALHIWNEEGTKPDTYPDDLRLIEYSINEERELLREVFKYMENYPMLVTFNGTAFDLPYLYYRAVKLKIPKEEIPFKVKPSKSPMKPFFSTLNSGIHFDLYLLFTCKALKAYAFKSAYLKNRLEDVTKALLPKGEEKLEVLNPDGTKKMMRDYTKYELIYYNYRDSNATLKLTTYDNFIVMNLTFVLMRLSKTGFDDFVEHQVSFWLKNLFFYEHRKANWLIPQERQIKSISKVSTTAKSKDKQFQGAVVVDTLSGVHFDVTVMDFASLYPSIIKTRNLSYETVDCCNHEECKKNIVPDTTHYVCKIHQGITSLILGSIRDIRVLYFKEADEKNKELIEEYKKEGKKDDALSLSQVNKFYAVMQSALKVFINAGYGVIASEEFYFNQIGAGESVTAYGRYSILAIIEQSKIRNILICGGDTDSCFLVQPTKEDIKYLIKWAWDNLGIVLDKDKECKYMAISSRKKNYLVSYYQKPNIESDSSLWKKPEIKGLKGKKSNTPQFIKKKFSEIVKYVDVHIVKVEDLDEVKKYMRDFLSKFIKELNGESKGIEFKDMIYSTRLSKEVVDYGDEDVRDFNRKLLQKAKEGSIQIRRQVDKFTQKKTEEKEKPKSLEDRLKIAYDQFEIKGFTQIAKCALLMLKKGVRIGKDDFVPMIKTNRKTTGGALPLSEVNSWSQVDKGVYLDEIASSFSQLYDCFDIDVDRLIDGSKGKGKVQSLEDTIKNAKKKDPNTPEHPKIEEPKKVEPKKKDTGLYALMKKK